jgi:membrane protease YdiL (CAAX protease family)
VLITLGIHAPFIALAIYALVSGVEGDELSEGETLFGVGLTLVLQQGTATAATLWALRTTWSQKVQGLGLNRYDWMQLWRPALMTIVLYGGVILYTVIMDLLGFVEPGSNVTDDFVQSPILIVGSFLMICVGAPLAEEIVFRGAIFGGLLHWGFWPAAVISGFLFSAVHGDWGSLIPFWIVGIGLAWLYWSRGSLWDAIICHAMFNFSSYLLLISGEA